MDEQPTEPLVQPESVAPSQLSPFPFAPWVSTFKEKKIIAANLDGYHSLFRLFWDYGDIQFDNRYPTAWVEFDRKKGNFMAFKFNKFFWDSLDEYHRTFICAHEMMHIFFKHGERGVDFKEKEVLNQAMDIVVNHYLVDQFKFKRAKIKGQENYCWIDTLFPGRLDMDGNVVEKDQTFAYYYDLLLKQKQANKKSKGKGQTVDIHGTPDGKGMGNMSPQDMEHLSDMLDKFAKNLSEEEKQDFIREVSKEIDKLKEEEKKRGEGKPGGQQAGTGGGFWSQITQRRVHHKKKWETVIKQWDRFARKQKDIDIERWDRRPRRFEDIMKGKNWFIPNDMNVEDSAFKEKRVGLWFFLDTSGSTYHLGERFFAAARSLNPKVFDIRLFNFDTKVVEVSLKEGKIYGGGGTDFGIIEDKIQEIIKTEKVKHATQVFLITDGFGTAVSPQHPERWSWFLTEGGSDSYIPKKSKKYLLKDYE